MPKNKRGAIALGIAGLVVGVAAGIPLASRLRPARASLRALPESIDLGILDGGAVGHGTAEIRNVGNGTLIISRVLTECGCTDAGVVRTVLGPGENTLLRVSFNSTGFHRAIRKHVFIETNELPSGVHSIDVNAYVRTGTYIDSDTLYLGAGRFGEHVAATVEAFRDGPTTEPADQPCNGAGPDKIKYAFEPWASFDGGERATCIVSVECLTQSVGTHVAQIDLPTSGGKSSPLKVYFDVLPLVSFTPEVVVATAPTENSEAPENLRLSWPQNALIDDVVVRSVNNRVDISEVGKADGARTFRVAFRKAPHSGFDVLRAQYREQRADRVESIMIPVSIPH
jgi:hypothetical protein